MALCTCGHSEEDHFFYKEHCVRKSCQCWQYTPEETPDSTTTE